MKNVFTQIGRAAALLMLGCSAVANVQAQGRESIILRYYQLDEEFVQAVAGQGYRSDAKLIVDDDPTFPKPSEGGTGWCNFNFSHPGRQSFGGRVSQPEIKVAGLDSVTLYYRIKGENFHLDNGVMKVAVNDLINNQSITINPLDVSRQVMLQKPKDRDGNPLDATLYFVNPKTSALDALPMDRSYRGDRPMLVDKEPFTYMICPENVPYFYHEGVSKGLSVDTLTADYRKAKEIHFRIKGLDGQFVPTKNYSYNVLFNIKHSCNESLWGSRNFEYNGQYRVNIDRETQKNEDWVQMYALPNDYYFSFWGASCMNEQGGPAGLEGFVHIDDRDVQDLVCDYSKYITLRTRCNMDVAVTPTDMLFTRKHSQPSVANKLLENVLFDVKTNTSPVYTSVVKDENGKLCTRIWAPFGYDTAELRGSFASHDYVFKNLDIANKKEFTFDLPNVGALRCIYPHVLYNQGAALMVNDKEIMKVKYVDPNHIYRPGGFEKMDTTYVYNDAADVAVSCLLETETDTFRTAVQQVRVVEGETVDVVMGLDHAVAVEEPLDFYGEEHNFNLSVLGNNGMKSFVLAKMRSWENKQTLYLFTGGEKFDYTLGGDRIIPVSGSLVLTNQLQYLKPSWSDYRKFTVTGSQLPKWAVWMNQEGRRDSIDIDLDHNYFYAAPGKIAFTTSSRAGQNYAATYTYNVDFNEDTVLDLPAQDGRAIFRRGETLLIPWAYPLGNEEGREGEVKLYLLKHPYIDGNTALDVEKGRTEQVYLIPGLYCAEDGQGNKVYFEVKKGENVEIDFNNPPVPPVGIENAELHTTAPAAYYDACGRLLDAPRKGLNLIRLQNGKVRKVMVK